MGALIIASLFILSEYPRLKLEPPYGDAIRISMGALLISSPFIPSEYLRLKLEPPYGDAIRISMGAPNRTHLDYTNSVSSNS
jgi:hypothetical protein